MNASRNASGDLLPNGRRRSGNGSSSYRNKHKYGYDVRKFLYENALEVKKPIKLHLLNWKVCGNFGVNGIRKEVLGDQSQCSRADKAEKYS